MKTNATLRHFFGKPAYRSIDRLGTVFTPQTLRVDQTWLADFLRTRFRHHTIFFPDTNFITGPTIDPTVWDQILQRRIGVTSLVLRELQGWITIPVRHTRLWRQIMSATPKKDGPIWVDSPERWTPDHYLGITYYIDLLAERKRFARRLVEEFEVKHGREPTSNERNHLFQLGRPPRDFHVFRPGEEEIRTGGNTFTDEELVVTACAVGLCSGHDTVVLTRDRGVFDQFVKLTHFLVVHYQGMRFAEFFAAHRASFQVDPMPTGDAIIDEYFVAENSFLVRKPNADPDHFVGWLLPTQFVPVSLYCIWLGGEGPFSFDLCCLEAERDLDRIVRTKGLTRGWNTNQILRHNCHVTGFPKTIPNPRNYVAVVQDREVYTPDGTMGFAMIDLVHAVTHFDVMSQPVPGLGTA